MEIEIPYKFKPRAYQMPLLKALDEGKNRAYIVWHRRAGKDKTLWNFIIKRAVEIVGQHFYLFPTFVQAKRDIWENIDNDGFKFLDHVPKEIIDGKPNETELKIKLKNGSIIQLIGTDKYDAIRGSNPKTCIFSEYAYQDPRAYNVVRPILRFNGGMALFDTTPFGENHAKDLWDNIQDNEKWFKELLTINDTDCVTEEDIDEDRQEGMSEEMIQQEYYCSWTTAMEGAYFAKHIKKLEENKHISDVPYDEVYPVTTFWDLGVDDSMSIIFVQQIGFTYRIIDCINDHGKGFEEYAAMLYKDKPYKYWQHFVPHDAKNREMGKSRKEGMERFKTLDKLLREEVVTMPRPKSLLDKIEATRAVLPKCYIDKENADFLIKSLKSYRQEYDEKTKKWKDTPIHDWSSHMASAMGDFALAVRNGEYGLVQSLTGIPEHQMPVMNQTTLDRRGGIVR